MLGAEKNIIQLKDVYLGYIPGKDLVESLNAEVREGEMIALVGRNGTGKSTLLRTIAGIQKAAKGEVKLNKLAIDEYKTNEFAALVSFVGTSKSIAENMSVYEMVSLGRHPYTNWWGALKEEDKDKIVESIRFVGMEAHIDSKVDRLSDGERQRVMIAAALAQDTKVIILDEPTAFLDIPNRIGIAEVLYKLRLSGKSVVFSTHDFDSAFNYADKLWVIHNNTLLQGAPEDLGISNIFEHIFEDSDVVFDEKNLRFKREVLQTKSVFIRKSNSKIFDWTCRALERIGYAILEENRPSEPEIFITENDSEKGWMYKHNDTSLLFSTLYELTGYLTMVR
ncbi:MAG: ABC transporter ATP-binding protein [Bacteroidales bacterium]|jgi:iron complex transport system ATP-binding protein|nr:ABC transporter ATP-binding protein [Bacteroidales bacterium]